ncbi:MAG: TolC family protein [Acidobacteriaceae bacterium]|nr:TolC family protein [Acidobacteriaceae bacterium]
MSCSKSGVAAVAMLLQLALCAPRCMAQSGTLLTLNEAIAQALSQNRPIRAASLDVANYDDRIVQNRTKALPSFRFEAESGLLLQRLDFIFERGVFGSFPGIGPVPSQNTSITTPIRLTAVMFGQIAEPLSQHYKIRLGTRQLQLGKQIAQEQLRAKRQSLTQSVKQLYYSMLETQSGISDLEEDVKLYRELERHTSVYFQQEAVLKSDLLQVRAKLAQTEYDLVIQQNNLATQKAQMNALLARDVRTAFEVMPVPEDLPPDLDLRGLEARALAARPEVLQARLQLQQAEVARKLAKADSIPDVSATINDVSLLNYGKIVPSNIATAGFTVTWEPFDWGRRKREVSEKQRGVEQATLAEKETESQVLVDLDDKFRRLAQFRQALKVARVGQESAQENVRITTKRYEQQASLLKDVLQSQAQLADVNHHYRQALLAFWNAKAELEKAMGEE